MPDFPSGGGATPAVPPTQLHIVSPGSAASSASPRRLGRYDIGEEIAHGGMGTVLRAHDPGLHRDLAVKVLRPGLLGELNEEERVHLLRRFEEEARITAQLQHPGIVPVHELGHDEHGLPFLVMKLVRGQTLEKMLAERPTPLHELTHFVGIFEQVCQAVAFAHAHRVIHRDLKPANVMVGRFGEVQVMDWGLARVLPSGAETQTGEQHQASAVGTLRSKGEEAWTQGAVGTWEFMPPEQANGETELIDERADVFALGGILCGILTGAPPYTAAHRHEVRRKAERGDVAEAFARLDGCGAESELVALAKACLSPEREQRPRHAGEVAERVAEQQRGVQERLRSAERQRAAAEARAEEARATARAERRARRRTLALVGVVLLALGLGGGAAWWYQQERAQRQAEQAARQAHAQTEATAGLEEALRLLRDNADQRDRDPERWDATVRLAAAAVARAEGSAATAEIDDSVARQVQEVRAKVEGERRDSGLRLELDRIGLAKTGVREGRYDEAAGAPLYREALRRHGIDLGDLPTATALVRSSQLRGELLAALADWWRLTTDDEEKRDLYHLLGEAEQGGNPLRARWLAAAEKRDGPALAALAAEVGAELPAADLANLARDLRLLHEMEAMGKLLRVGQGRYPDDFWINHELGMWLREQRPPQREEAIRFLAVAVALRNQSPGAHLNLGVALNENGQRQEALRCFHKALEIDPNYAHAHGNLGIVLQRMGKNEEALRCFRKGVELDPTCAQAYFNLGVALKDGGKLEEAIGCFRKAIALNPRDAGAHGSLGLALYTRGEKEEALRCFRTYAALAPSNATAQNILGGALEEKGERDEAIRCFRKAIAIDPRHADAHYNLAKALSKQGQKEEALHWLRKTVEIDPRNVTAHHSLASALSEKGDKEGAIRSYRKVIELEPGLAPPYFNLGLALRDTGEPDEAIRCYKKAIAIDPRYARAYAALGQALKARGEKDEAIRCYRKAIEVDPKLAVAYVNLGAALREKGEVDEAIRCYRKAIELDPGDAMVYDNLGNDLGDKGEIDEAIRCYRKAIELDPRFAKAHDNLGWALQMKGEVAEAIRWHRKAIALDPGYAMARNNLGGALLAQGEREEAIRCFRKAIELDPRHADAHYNLGVALKEKGEVPEAIRCYRKAIALKPRFAPAHRALVEALLAQGEFGAARDAARRCLDLLPPQHPLRGVVAQLLQQAETALALEKKLPAVVKGDARPSNAAEALALAQICERKEMHAAAVRLYSNAFAADAKLADDQEAQHRYNAACSAALAAAGKGNDADKLRRQALEWLQADLNAWGKHLAAAKAEERKAIRDILEHWQKDADLASVRDAAALAALTAEERDAWKKLWTDVAALAEKARPPR
jgi:tetratricopeptide (TPR) repeat protein